MLIDEKGWLPEGVTRGDLDDGDFAWLSDKYKAGDEPASSGRKLPYKIHSKVNEAGWKAAWSRAHQMDDADFDGGPSREDVYKTLLDDKPKDIDVSNDDDGKDERPPNLHYKTFAFHLDTAETKDGLNPGEFQGYASTWDLDDGGDIIEKGAFAAGLKDFLANGAICWQHDWTEPIGKPIDAQEDDKGLLLKGQISQTARGKDALTLMRDGVVKKMSIGYEPKGVHYLSDDEGKELLGEDGYQDALRNLPWYASGLRKLTDVKLYEVSPVTVPMNPQAAITGVKDGSLAGLSLNDHFQTVLAAEGEYIARVKALADLRRKEGRMLSEANRSKLQTMRDSLSEHLDTLDDLLAPSLPADSGDIDGDAEGEKARREMERKAREDAEREDRERKDAMRREFLRFQRLQADLNGVPATR